MSGGEWQGGRGLVGGSTGQTTRGAGISPPRAGRSGSLDRFARDHGGGLSTVGIRAGAARRKISGRRRGGKGEGWGRAQCRHPGERGPHPSPAPSSTRRREPHPPPAPRHPREGGDLLEAVAPFDHESPAFAGMTGERGRAVDGPRCGDPSVVLCVLYLPNPHTTRAVRIPPAKSPCRGAARRSRGGAASCALVPRVTIFPVSLLLRQPLMAGKMHTLEKGR